MKLITVIAQDVRDNNVLMVAYANAAALARTRKTGWLHFWSRSRKKLWKKGESSGNRMKVVSLHYDCDRDAILARVLPEGPACHRGTPNCFSKKTFRGSGALDDLAATIEDRRRHPKRGSYTRKLLGNREELAKKIIEEGGEFALATLKRNKKEIVHEAADLIYHLMTALNATGVTLEAVEKELKRRKAK